MTCPFYSNGKKECTTVFAEVTKLIDEKRCKSKEDYTDCIFFKMLSQPEKDQCKYMEICNHVAVHTVLTLPYEEIKKQCETYCLSKDNKKNCAIYQLIDDLKRVPKGLLPDGSFVVFKE